MVNFAHHLPMGLHSRVSVRVYSLSLWSPELTTRWWCYFTHKWGMDWWVLGHVHMPVGHMAPISTPTVAIPHFRRFLSHAIYSVAQTFHQVMCDFNQTTSLLVDTCFHIHQPAATGFAIPRWGAQWVLGLSQGLPRGNSGLR